MLSLRFRESGNRAFELRIGGSVRFHALKRGFEAVHDYLDVQAVRLETDRRRGMCVDEGPSRCFQPHGTDQPSCRREAASDRGR